MMEPGDLADLWMWFFIAVATAGGSILVLYVIVSMLWVKVRYLARDLRNSTSNQLLNQRNSADDFCYSNPAIVPGEVLSRRGFSMYGGNDEPIVFPTVTYNRKSLINGEEKVSQL